jgi:hypothetical protein
MPPSPPFGDTSELSERSVEHRTISLIIKRLRLLLLICRAIALIDRTKSRVASPTTNADIEVSDTAFGLEADLFFTVATEGSSR